MDRTFNFDTERAKTIFKGLIADYKENKINVCYHFEICADLIDEETVEILKTAPLNLFRFEIGVQSTNEQVLKNINRFFKPEKTLEKIRLLRSAENIPLHLDLICGLPGEDLESIKKSFDEVYLLSDCLQLGFLKLLHGTELRNSSEKYGMSFLKQPPYTVLETQTLSFSQLSALRHIEKAMDIFESDSFLESRKYIMQRIPSPYEFYFKLSTEKELFSLSRKRQYGFILRFSENYLSRYIDIRILNSYLLFDFLLNNQGTPPSELLPPTDNNLNAGKEILKDYIKNSQIETLHFPSCELYNFEFDTKNTFILDRKQRLFKLIPKIVF